MSKPTKEIGHREPETAHESHAHDAHSACAHGEPRQQQSREGREQDEGARAVHGARVFASCGDASSVGCGRAASQSLSAPVHGPAPLRSADPRFSVVSART